jgi:non-canonical purine NTP pyrophosphatase (RdgB/HAM1 family)
MKEILLATGNQRKINEANAACVGFDIKVIPIKLDIDEIQSKDPVKISNKKAEDAYSLVNNPVVVTDTYWNIPALNGFPGGYMKDVAEWLSSEDFLNLIKDKADKRISFTESITYKDKDQVKTFSKEFWGEFTDKSKGTGNSIEQVAKFNGMTIGESRDIGKLSHDPKDYVWIDFANWFSSQP